jgi:hypothetical protein
MARRHYWQFLVTDEGNPIENADITITSAGTDTPVFVYTSESGGAGTATAPQVTTSRKGYFEFWVGDTTEGIGYPYTTKFKIAWYSAGVSAGYIDYVDVFSTSVAEVDLASVDTGRNKAVSNFLAKGWEDHSNSVLYTNGVTTIHGMLAMNLSDNTNIDYNRLISNEYAYKWDTHADAVMADSPHGISGVDETITEATKNKTVSNTLAYGWEQHRTNTALDEHAQYSLVDGTRKYTAGVGYANGSIVSGVGVDDFVTKAYVTAISNPFDQDLNTTDFVTFAGVTVAGTILGNGSLLTNITFDQLFDANIVTPSDGDILEYQSGYWVNTQPTLSSLTDTTISAPADYQVLSYSSGSWVNGSKINQNLMTTNSPVFANLTITNTLTASVFSASTSIGTVNLVVSGDITAPTLPLKYKTLEIGDWNMDVTANVSVLHGLTLANIRTVEGVIRNDTAVGTYVIGGSDTTNHSWVAVMDGTSVYLTRLAGGGFDNGDFDSVGYNRGWITIGYV